MNEKAKNSVVRLSAAGVALAAIVAGTGFSARAAAGVALGGLWNLASLWCLAQMLQAWIGPKPSQRRAVAWLLVKFPLLYAAIFFVFQARLVPFEAFSVGFSVVLVSALAIFLAGARQMMGTAKPQ